MKQNPYPFSTKLKWVLTSVSLVLYLERGIGFLEKKMLSLEKKYRTGEEARQAEAWTVCPGHRSPGPGNKGDRQQESASPSLFKQDNDADRSLLPPFQSGVFATTEQTGRPRGTDHPSSREYNGPFKEPSLPSESGR